MTQHGHSGILTTT